MGWHHKTSNKYSSKHESQNQQSLFQKSFSFHSVYSLNLEGYPLLWDFVLLRPEVPKIAIFHSIKLPFDAEVAEKILTVI